MSAPRGLTSEEAEAWEKLAKTVTPIAPIRAKQPVSARAAAEPPEQNEPSHSKNHGEDKVGDQVPQAPQPDFATLLRQGVGSKAASKPGSRLGGKPKSQPISAPKPPSDTVGGLDGHWDKRLKSGAIEPDFTLDLHGHTLDSAHDRLESGLAQARAMGARVILLIAGKSRPVDAADRGTRRGAIRSKILDWLAAGPHGAEISAIRKAHRRHGGEGALYLVLKRRR